MDGRLSDELKVSEVNLELAYRVSIHVQSCTVLIVKINKLVVSIGHASPGMASLS
jgi:hypothetical protein